MDSALTPPMPSISSKSRLKTPVKSRQSLIPGMSGTSSFALNAARRQSIWDPSKRARKPSTADVSEVSESVNTDINKVRTVLPTYQLKPTTNCSPKQISKIAQDLLDLYLSDTTYNPDECRQKTKDISRAITDQVKKVAPSRFKVVTVVNIGNLEDFSSVKISSRSVWDETTDKFTTAEFHNESLYAVAMIYTLYTE